MKNGISIVIPTCNGGRIFRECIEKIGRQAYQGGVQLIVVDSGSTDGTGELAEQAGALVKRIPKTRFHHARTRNEALSLTTFDRVVFTVQDAVPCTTTWLSDLEKALEDPLVAAAYTDQVPHDDATPYARFENQGIRDFRGQEPLLQGLDSVESFQKMAYYDAYRAIVLDNVCAIYKKASLMDVPFPEVDFAEDLAWSLATLLKGRKVLYQPAIKVKHSHNRLPQYGFHRQIVNSFWCARIMRRVARDMSSLALRDLLSLTSDARLILRSLRSDMMARGDISSRIAGKTDGVVNTIVRKYSLKNRVKWLVMDWLGNEQKDVHTALYRIKEAGGHDVVTLLKWIRTNTGATSEEALIDILEQITALALGRIYGEAYASHMIKGTVSSDMKAFIRPYVQGI